MSNSMNQPTPTQTGKSQLNFTSMKKKNTNSISLSPKSKSRYAQKSRKNKNKKPVAPKKGPVNTYTSVCCGVPTTKKPCTAVSKKDALTQTLGKFRCGQCGKRCNVTVSKFKALEVVESPTGATVTFGSVDGADLGRGTGTEVPHA